MDTLHVKVPEPVFLSFSNIWVSNVQREGVAVFLQYVTSKNDQEQYWVHIDRCYKFVNNKDFSEAIQAFHIGRQLHGELHTPFIKSESHDVALLTRKYGVSKREMFKACLARQILLTKRNSFVYIFRLGQLSSIASFTIEF